MRALIVGAGIGGLTAAVALRQLGFDAHVYEQARVLREVGAGLALGPNAVRVLHRLGLAEALRTVGVRSESWDLRDWQSGAVLGRVPLADAAEIRWGAPFYNVHRADLHDALGGSSGISTSRSGRVACPSSSTARRLRSASPMGGTPPATC